MGTVSASYQRDLPTELRPVLGGSREKALGPLLGSRRETIRSHQQRQCLGSRDWSWGQRLRWADRSLELELTAVRIKLGVSTF